jgi:two-component system sensor histidine kinase KdpD
MSTPTARRTPEEWLQIAHREEGIAPSAPLEDNESPQRPSRGRHKIFLGFAAGVGKTYKMLEEANRRRERGQDVVIRLHRNS